MNKKTKYCIIEIVLILLILIAAINIFIWIGNKKKNENMFKSIAEDIEIIEDISEENLKDKYKINFQSLKEKNPDVVAWIKVKGTNIEYPVIKGNDNDYYINHSFDKSYNKFGWVFANYINKIDGNDKNIALFAHSMRDGSMFDSLKNTLTEEWQNKKENLSIIFITENEANLYEVFSTYKIKDETYFFNNNFKDENDFMKFIDTVKSRSNHDYKVDVTTNDKILTLSTCDTNNKYRIVLHAKKIVKE